MLFKFHAWYDTLDDLWRIFILIFGITLPISLLINCGNMYGMAAGVLWMLIAVCSRVFWLEAVHQKNKQKFPKVIDRNKQDI